MTHDESLPPAADPFQTDHLNADLALRSARGSVVTLAAEALKFAAGTGATMALARLMGPEDFGLAAIALATVGILSRMKDAGLFTATVQSPQITASQATMLFWLSAALSGAMALLTLGLAPAVGWFYHDGRLIPVTAALALVPLLDGTSRQVEAVMNRQMRFATISLMDSGALAMGVVGALALAWAGAGYWALVAQELVYSAAYACAVWTLCRWRPGRPVRNSGVAPLVQFGLRTTGAGIFNFLAMNLDTVVVGRVKGAQQAGVYDRAYRILTIPSTLLNQPLTGVAVPALSRLQADGERYRTFYQNWIQVVFALTMPIVVFLFVDAERAILTVLGERWSGIAPIYRALAPAAFIGRFNVVTDWLYVTTGRTDRQLRWNGGLLIVMIVAYAVGVRWGAFGVAVAHSLVVCSLWYPGVAYCCRTTPVRPRDVLGVMRLPAAAAAAAGLVLFAALTGLPRLTPLPLAFVMDALLFGVAYLAAWAVVPAGRKRLDAFVGLARETLRGRLS